jgi:cobalt-zinc-cadmium resistance protein CzcA
VEQNINFPTVYLSQNKVNKMDILIAGAELNKQKQIITKMVSQSYFEILFLLNKQKYYVQIDSLYSNLNKGAEESYKVGNISKLDLLNIGAKRQQLKSSLNQLKYDLDIAYSKLQTVIQFDSAFIVPYRELELLPVNEYLPEKNPGLELMKMQTAYQGALVTLERNKLLPDLSLSYFNGTNKFTGSKNYNGFQFGVAVPLFFGGQTARIKANMIAADRNKLLEENYKITLNSKYFEFKNQLLKYREAIDLYNNSGKILSDEIIRTSMMSYKLGEIDFLSFVISIENALSITLDYYDNVAKYNQIALEINYINN